MCCFVVKMFVVLLFLLFKVSTPQDISSLVDVKTLSELPLEKLLQVKNTFKENPEEKIENKSSDESPEALALQSKRNPSDRGGYHYHYEEEHSKKSGKKSVQSIFQISVTTLAFLAFGGYLLCLLVQAIKGKTTTMVVDVTTAAPVAFFRPIRRRRPTRRPIRVRRPTRPSGYESRPTRPRVKREVWPDADPDNMYYALMHLSEAYANYHTIDYRKFNFTTKSYVN